MYNKKEWVSKEVITKEALNNIENGIADLDERLEELEDKEVEVDLSGYQEKTDNDLVTESKDIVGAINELFQSANNGKELIADAIGEPLNAEDTFAAMGNDIKGLLSTFKTNMMNNGVAVESTDKFKSLIDKIATMAEEDEDEDSIYQDHILDANNQIYKANYYDNFESRKTFAYTSYTTNFDSKNESYNGEMTIYVKADTNTSNYGLCATLDFVNYTPIDLTNVNSITIVAKKSYIQTNTQFGFLDFTSSSSGFNSEGAIFSRKVEIAMSTSEYETYSIDTSDMVGKHCICIESKFTGLTNKNAEAFVFIQQITLNTTEKPTDPLRDSLASILEEEGVEVTEEDTMASLIAKLGEAFDRKNEEIANSGGLDIISATELPATGKENQICVITDNPVDNYVVTSNLNDNANEDSITLYNVSDSTSITPIVISSNGITSYNYISQVCQGSTNLASYVYSEEQWIPLTSASHYLLKNGTLVTGSMLDKFGTFNTGYTAGTGLKITIDSSSYYVNILACNKSVDFSSLNFSKIKVTAYTSAAQLTPYLYVVSSNQTGQLRSSLMSDISPYLYDQSSVHASYGATKHTYELDVSGWSSATGYFGIGGTWSGASAGTLYITDIEFE